MSTPVPTKESIVPRYGTEAKRAEKAAQILGGELHQTTDQGRLFIKNALVSGGLYLGLMADEAERLALNTTHERGCWPGDVCEQISPVGVFRCIANHGADAEDWLQIGGGGSTGIDMREVMARGGI
jgi:hypothetical protein